MTLLRSATNVLCEDIYRLTMKTVSILFAISISLILFTHRVDPAPHAGVVAPAVQVLFDDFSYANKNQLKKNGWIVRTERGWRGVPGATWSEKDVTLLSHPDEPKNKIIRMT